MTSAHDDDDDGVVAHEEVLQCVYDFLHHCGYRSAVQALQVESGVPYNTIHVDASASTAVAEAPTTALSSAAQLPHADEQRDATAATLSRRVQTMAGEFAAPSPAALERAVMEGSWAEVLHVYVDTLLLPFEVKCGLYELIVHELLYLHGLQPAARALLQHAPVFAELRRVAPARAARLTRAVDGFDVVAWQDAAQHGGNTRHGVSGADGDVGLTRVEAMARRKGVLRQLRAAMHFTSAPYDHALTSALLLQRRRQRSHSSRNAPTQRSRSPHTCDDAHGHVNTTGDVDAAAAAASSSSLPLHARVQLPYPLHAPRRVLRTVAYDTTRATSNASADGSSNDDGGDNNTVPSYVAARPHSPLLVMGRSDGAVAFAHVQSDGVVVAAGSTPAHGAAVLVVTFDVVHVHTTRTTTTAATATATNTVADTHHTAASEERAEDVWVAVGYRDGSVKVYKAQTHKLLRRFACVHSMGVTAVVFAGARRGRDVLDGHSPLLMTSAYDATLLLLDVAAGTTVCRVDDAHHGTFANAMLGLSPCAATLHTMALTNTTTSTARRGRDDSCLFALSAGNDGCVCCWRIVDDDDAGDDDGDDEACTHTRLQPPPSSAAGLPLHRTAPRLVRLGGNHSNGSSHSSNTYTLHGLHAAFAADDLPTQLVVVPRDDDDDNDDDVSGSVTDTSLCCEVLLLTRAARALLVRVVVHTAAYSKGEGGVSQGGHRHRGGSKDTVSGEAVTVTVLCVLHAPSPLRRAASYVHVTRPPSMSCAMLSVYLTDAEGHVLLYNIPAVWREAATWSRHGGSVAVVRPTDESAAVILARGAAVADVHIELVTATRERQQCDAVLACDEGTCDVLVVAYAPSLSMLYVLQ